MEKLLNDILNGFEHIAGIPVAEAHCDIPCKIYDPSAAQIAALTMLRMVDLIEETAKNHGVQDIEYFNSMARFVAVKEEHGRRCKEEVVVIWGDYFKQPQFDQFPEIHDVCHRIMTLCSQAKQAVDREHTMGLIEKVNRLAEIFWATKDISTKRVICPYPPSVEVIYPVL